MNFKYTKGIGVRSFTLGLQVTLILTYLLTILSIFTEIFLTLRVYQLLSRCKHIPVYYAYLYFESLLYFYALKVLF